MVQAPHRPAEPDDPAELVVQIVAMRRRHLRTVMRIESRVYPKPWSHALFTSELGMSHSRAYFVARVEGSVVGYGGLMVIEEEGHITTLAVDPPWHRRAIASRLLLTLATEAIVRRVCGLTLEVRVSNTGAQELYRRFGFAPAGVRRKYYPDTNEDALVMWAHDIDGDAYAARLAAIEAKIPGLTLGGETS